MRRVDSGLSVEIVRLVGEASPGISDSSVVMEIDPTTAVGVRAAGRYLSETDLALIQHEFGLYGENDGEAVVDLVRSIDTARMVVLHTVVPEPTPNQKALLRTMADESEIVVLCNSAARLLHSTYDIGTPVHVVPHGATWSASPPNPPPHRQIITWGLLGPGKGIERALLALASLKEIEADITYRIVGKTHPVVAARNGTSYRTMLESMVRDLGVWDMVEFIDRYVDDSELHQLVRSSDLVVVPYDNADQVSSGVITEAVGVGRPVVATRFPFAEEMLGGGAGTVVDHDPVALSESILRYLTDSIHYREAVRHATELSSELSWPTVAGKLAGLIRRFASPAATA